MYLMGMSTSETPTPSPGPSSQPSPQSIGNCDHFGPPEFAMAAEAYLRGQGIPASAWDGRRFGWGGQLTESKYFKGLYMELARRESQWVVTAIDRSKTPLDEAKLGLRELK
jgi:hypothetical protein